METGQKYDRTLQYLTIAYAKHVGMDDQGRVVGFHPEESSLGELRLSPVLVLSLVLPAYKLYHRRLVSPSCPGSLSAFLAEAWARNAVLGLPRILEVKQVVLDADRGFAQWVSNQGIVLRVSPDVKRIGGFERCSLDVMHYVSWPPRGRLPVALERANQGLAAHDQQRAQFHFGSSTEVEEYYLWRKTPRPYCSTTPLETDWDPSDIKLPVPRRPRPGLEVWHPGEDTLHVPAVAVVARMWPAGRRTFLKDMDVLGRDFDYWVRGEAHLPQAAWSLIHERLNVVETHYGELAMRGGYLLIATTMKDVVTVYDALSDYGDLFLSAELLGPGGQMPPMRFFVFQSRSGRANIILFEHGGRAEGVLSSGKLERQQVPIVVDGPTWESVLQIIEFREDFANPWLVGAAFGAKHWESVFTKHHIRDW